MRCSGADTCASGHSRFAESAIEMCAISPAVS
jgi:hypothetical protein